MFKKNTYLLILFQIFNAPVHIDFNFLIRKFSFIFLVIYLSRYIFNNIIILIQINRIVKQFVF